MSYEKGIQENIEKGEPLPLALDIPILKYLWQSNPLSNKNRNSIPRFLRKISVLNQFSETELKLLTRYLHLRTFGTKELIFDQGDPGVGFYFIFSGNVHIIAKDHTEDLPIDRNDTESLDKEFIERHITLLERFDFFGELALLQKGSIRTAAAVAQNSCTLLGVFQPDLEEMIQNHPTLAAKLLQAISLIVANRFTSVTREIRVLKYKLDLASKIKEEEN